VPGKPTLPGEMRRGLWQVEIPDKTIFRFPLDKLWVIDRSELYFEDVFLYDFKSPRSRNV
jgi:hypothetical protein